MHWRMLVSHIVVGTLFVIGSFMVFCLTNSILVMIILICLGAFCIFIRIFYPLDQRNDFSLGEILKQNNETELLTDVPTVLVVPFRRIDLLLHLLIFGSAIIILSLSLIGKLIIMLDRRFSVSYIVNHRIFTFPGALWLTNRSIRFLPDLRIHQYKTITILLSHVVSCGFTIVNLNPCLRIETLSRKYDFLVTENNLSSMKWIVEKIKKEKSTMPEWGDPGTTGDGRRLK
jgi:hypothetical protein